MQAININNAQAINANIAATKASEIVRREATQKIIMFVSILVCIVAAVNL